MSKLDGTENITRTIDDSVEGRVTLTVKTDRNALVPWTLEELEISRLDREDSPYSFAIAIENEEDFVEILLTKKEAKIISNIWAALENM